MASMVKKPETQELEDTQTERRVIADGTFEERRKPAERRRTMVDRRSGFDRRRGPGHRRTEERRAAEEGEMTDEQFDFLMAIDQYKRANQRPFPTWTEVLEIVKALGYRKVAEQQPLESFRKADKVEPVEIG
jgi:FMN phosphatase YigB (HAD superfamily)